MKVVHLPVYPENAYQPLLMEALRAQDIETMDGGGGGNFFRTALFKWKADILHFHWLHPYLLRPSRFASNLRSIRFLAEVFLLRMAGTRIVWTVHNLVNHDRRFPGLERFYTRLFVRLADGVIVHSRHALAAAVEAFHPARQTVTAVIPQGSYAGHYPNQLSREECRGRLGLGAGETVFLFLGRVEPYKGVLDLVRSFRQLEGNVRLLIAGRVADPESRKVLEDAIGDAANIRLCEGFVPDDKLQVYFNAADAYVYPVRNILNSGSIPLAMSFGLPCIAPRLDGVLEALGEQGGILYNPNQADGLLGALKQAFANPGRLADQGRANLQSARDWTWREAAAQTAAVYRRCLGPESAK